jgi:hypothetical protein
MLALVMMITISVSNVFAGEKKVSPDVLQSFKTEFSGAKEVNWTVAENFYKAEFVWDGIYVTAFYSTEGEMLGLTRYISTTQLPINLMSSVKKNFSDYWVSDLFELNNKSGSSYYITLQNADYVVILKSTNGENWSEYEKTKKA